MNKRNKSQTGSPYDEWFIIRAACLTKGGLFRGLRVRYSSFESSGAMNSE